VTNNYTIEITSQALVDLIDIADWYYLQRKGLEQEFILSFEVALHRLTRNPLGYSPGYKKSRSIFLQRFPYKIIFGVYGTIIKVYAVYHHSRNPKLIKKRIK
jgi:plasmid stabilization system protein ParE